MKKSLLTLVLAGVAATATAGTIYSNVSGETKTNLDFYGSLKVVADKGHTNTSVYGQDGSYETLKERDRAVSARSRFGLKGEYTDGTLTYSFNTRFTNTYTYATTQVRPHTGPETPVKSSVHERSGYNLDFGYLTVAHKQLGSLTYGKTGTVLDLAEGDHSNSFSGVYYSAVSAPVNFKNTFLYRTPEFYGVNAVASYGSESSSESAKNKQYGFGLEANKFDTNVGVYFAKTTSKVGSDVVAKANSATVHVVNNSVKGLTVGLTGSYERTKVPGLVSSSRTEAYGVGAKVSYAVNQYVNPYAGAGFVKYNYSQNTYNEGTVQYHDKASQKVASAYVGLESTLVKYQDFKLSTFGEFVYNRSADKVETTTYQRSNVKFGTVGVTASF